MLKKSGSFRKVKAQVEAENKKSGLCSTLTLTSAYSYLAAALLGTRRVSARQGWAGEKAGLFEHPAEIFFCCAVRADHRRSGVPT